MIHVRGPLRENSLKSYWRVLYSLGMIVHLPSPSPPSPSQRSRCGLACKAWGLVQSGPTVEDRGRGRYMWTSQFLPAIVKVKFVVIVVNR